MKLAISALLVLALAAGARAETIKEIEVAENSKTNDDTVILIADVDVGDEFSFELLDRVKVKLVSSGLFKDVDVFSTPVRGGVRVTILAKDKHSWVIAPTFYNQPGNVGGGLGFGENNLFGTNKKILVYGQVATADSFFLAGYIDPALAGSRFNWQMDTFLRREVVTEYKPPTDFLENPRPVRESTLQYLNAGAGLGVALFGGASFSLRLRGAHVSFTDAELAEGAEMSDVVDDPLVTTVPEPGSEGWDVSTEAILKFDRRANWYGITTGNLYRLSYERALPALGSEFDYWYAGASALRATKFFEEHNFIIKAAVQYGRDMPFQQEFTAGGTGLRGYQNRQFRGDFKANATIEYSVPLFKIKSVAVRGLGFWDSAYTAFLSTDDNEDAGTRAYLPGHDETGTSPFKNGVGGGIRLYIRSIVIPLLGLDFGYGLEGQDYNIYFAVGLTDL